MKDYSKKIITIPNILSVFRLALIVPMFIAFFKEKYLLSFIIIVISGVSDVIDGIIARKFNMVSDVGKLLDPIADKLTQISIMVLLSTKQILLLIPCAMLVIKELISGFIGIYVVRRIKHMLHAEWHGKLSTVFLYILMGAHMLMLIIRGKIFLPVSYALIAVSTVLIIISFVLYLKRYARLIKEIKSGKENRNKKDLI